MRFNLLPTIALVVVTSSLFAIANRCEAKSSKDMTYGIDQVFSTAQRFVRVDKNCKITDRDKEAAFLVWECLEKREGKELTLRASLEMFRTKTDRGQEFLRVQANFTDEPRYMELRFLELLDRKLREDHGLAPAPPPEPPASSDKKPDGSKGSSDAHKAPTGDLPTVSP